MKELYRHKSEYPDADQSEFPSDVETFTYTDGGVFQNEPLGMAKNFVDEIDDGDVALIFNFKTPPARWLGHPHLLLDNNTSDE